MPLAFLERAGYRPATLDLAVEALDPKRVAQARLVAISVPMHTAMRIGIQFARKVRELNPSVHVCFHGVYAPLNAKLLREGLADSLLGGECEEELVKLVRNLEVSFEASSPATGPSADAGSPKIALRKLDFPVPNRAALLPLERYAQLEEGSGQRLAGYVETTRGCLHHCRHCPIPVVYEGRFFAVPVPVVLEDARRQVASGATHLVRVAAWAVAPSFAGLFMQGVSLATPLFIGAGMKILYDAALFVSFRRLKPPEETESPAS